MVTNHRLSGTLGSRATSTSGRSTSTRGTKRAASPEDEESSKEVRRSGRVVPQRGRHAAKKTNAAKRQRRTTKTQADFNVAGPSGSGSSAQPVGVMHLFDELVEDEAERGPGVVRAGAKTKKKTGGRK